MSHFTIQGAHGRTYASKRALIADWNADLDFRDLSYGATRTYLNRACLRGFEGADGACSIEARYGKRGEKSCVFQNGDPTPAERVKGNGPRPFYRAAVRKLAGDPWREQRFTSKAKALAWASRYANQFGYLSATVHKEDAGVLTLMRAFGYTGDRS